MVEVDCRELFSSPARRDMRRAGFLIDKKRNIPKG